MFEDRTLTVQAERAWGRFLAGLTPATADRYERIVRRWVLPVFGDWWLDEIDERTKVVWTRALAEEAGYAPATIERHLRVLERLLAACEASGRE